MEHGSKKKIHSELKLYCPLCFNDEESFQFYAQVKAKILAIRAELQGEGDATQRLQQADKFFLEQSRPLCFDSDSSENAALLMDANFETLCAILEGNGVTNAGHLTTLQFYLRIEHFKKVNQALKKITPDD